MARPGRVCMPLLTYHVYSRCIEWKSLMEKEYVKELFLEVITKTQEKYSFELSAYVIMENHFHMIIRTVENGATISRIMQYIKARFAEKFNRMNARIGPFWNERFRDVIVEHQQSPLTYFLWLLWYIAWNPVRKGLVKKPEHYTFSSINCYLTENAENRLTITIHEYYLMLGSSFRKRLDHFLQYEEIFRAHIMKNSPKTHCAR
ncbi:MAG TPA: transposase [Spirochaetota bacterium]|nr:transposase [Spirochaetota bacterium]